MGTMASTSARLVYRSVLMRVLAVCYALFSGWWLVTLIGSHPRDAAATAAWLLAIGYVLYAVLWRPAVVIEPEGVTLVNVVRDVRVPWAALEAVETRYALTLHAAGNRYASWAAAAPGRGSTGVGVDRSSRDLRSDSGAAAFMVEQGWAGWRERPGALRDAEPPVPVVDVRWSIPVVTVAAALLATAVLATAVLAPAALAGSVR